MQYRVLVNADPVVCALHVLVVLDLRVARDKNRKVWSYDGVLEDGAWAKSREVWSYDAARIPNCSADFGGARP